MSKKTVFIRRNLSVITLITVYLIMAIVHLISNSFIIEDQLALILTMLPFILIGLALDFILRRSEQKEIWLQVIVQLLPLGIFIMYLVSSVMIYFEMDLSLEIFDYLIWVLLILPFFITSYRKAGLKPRIMNTLIGTGAFAVVYIFLTTQTNVLNKNYSATIYIITYFMMLYTASGIVKLPLLGMVLGVLNAVILLGFRYFPITPDAKAIGWDYDIFGKIELLIISTLIICILVRVCEAVKTKAV